MDRFEAAIAVAATSTAVISVALVWLLTDGEWYLQVAAALLAWAACWLSMGITSKFAEDE